MNNRAKTRKHRIWILGCAAALTTLPALAESSYSYPQVLEGPAMLVGASGDFDGVDLYQPILVGDRIRVPYGSRLELALADRSVLRAEGESEIGFESIAYSAEREDRSTVIRIDGGNAQLIVPEYAQGDALPRLETPDATIYVHRAGSYRITVGRGWTELVVRAGLAEAVTERGSLLVHPGEVARMQGIGMARLQLDVADPRDALERWGDWLSAEADHAEVPYVDESLRYAARPLAERGIWLEIDRRPAWRPTVVADWRPYVHGYWRQTPIGLTWVSYDPWGHLTDHYGSWDLVPGHGWVWYPGVVYAPAQVHWYWGPTYVGWCPSGYYLNHYARYRSGSGLSLGLYGWAGGEWSPFSDWSFTLHADFGRRQQERHVHPGEYFARRQAGPRLERGIVTTESRELGGRPGETFAELRRQAERRERTSGRPLPDVSDFVARKPLTADLERVVLKPEQGARSIPSARVTTPRAVPAKPIVRPEPTPRVATPRAVPSKPAARPQPAPRVAYPRVVPSKPEVRPQSAPRVAAPRVVPSKPEVRPQPAPRVAAPRVVPSKPEVRPQPAPRVAYPHVVPSKPAGRPEPTPRVATPRALPSKPEVRPQPAPRVAAPRALPSKPEVRPQPAPRVATPRVATSNPAVGSAPPPKPDRTVDNTRSRPQTRPQAQAEKRPQPEKKVDSQSDSKGAKSRQRD